MELRHLRYFAAAAREEHFGNAARRLGVAQSALSRRIQDLEAEIGVVLFERLPRGVRLSPAGRVFFEAVQSVLGDLDRAVERIAKLGRTRKAVVRLGYSEIASNHRLVPKALSAFKAQEPEVKLELLPMSSRAQLKALKARTIDVAIVYDVHCEPAALAMFHHRRLDGSRIVLATPKAHRLARRKVIRAADLRDEPVLWPAREGAPRLFDRLLNACLEAGLPPLIRQETATYSSLISLVSAGMGVSFVGSEAAGAGHDKVAFKPVADLDLAFNVELLWRKGQNSEAANDFIAWMIGFCARHAGEEMRVAD